MDKKPLLILLASTIFMVGYWLPEDRHIPVAGKTPADLQNGVYVHKVGGLGVPKGINIAASKGTPVQATTSGLVLYRDTDQQGNHSVWVLGAKWRLHHYANLAKVDVSPASWVKTGETIGTVGKAAASTPTAPNLYYAIRSLPPQMTEWKPENAMGLEQVFYVDPHQFLTAYQQSGHAGGH